MQNFEWALQQIAAGNRVRATYWSSFALYIYADYMPSHRYRRDIRNIYVKCDDGQVLFWRSRPYDEQTAEWVLVTDDMLPPLLEIEQHGLTWTRSGHPKS